MMAFLFIRRAGIGSRCRQPSWYESRDTWKKCPVLLSVHVTPEGSLLQVIAPTDRVCP
jgi:hypothetical protein